MQEKLLLLKLGHCPIMSVAVIKPFSESLKEWRGKRLQKEAAAILNVPLGTYLKWEYGKRVPKRYILVFYQKLMLENPDVRHVT